MPFEIVTIPCRADNYAFLLRGAGRTALIDAPDAAPIQAELDRRGWALDEIWLTHHHDDHIVGVPALRPGARVIGAAADAHRLPALDQQLAEGDSFDFDGAEVTVHDVSGHTVGHIAFYVADAGAVFTGDSLMAMGCGRLFEGTAPQMWVSLSKLMALPPETLVCSGHEYTQSNVKFALTVEPENTDLQARAKAVDAARAQGAFTVPSRLSDELATNPFVRAHLQVVKDAIGLPSATDAEAFGEIRARKDRF